MNIEDYNLVMYFVNRNPNFTLGFEAGVYWEQLKKGVPDGEILLIHIENEDQILMMCSKLYYTVKERIRYDDTWMGIKVVRNG